MATPTTTAAVAATETALRSNTRPLPGRGYELWRFEERCSVCEQTPRLKVKAFRGRPWNLCLNDDCPTMVEMREKRAERMKAREEAQKRKEAEEKAKGTAADSTAAAPTGKGKGKGRTRKAPKTTTRTKRARTSAGSRGSS